MQFNNIEIYTEGTEALSSIIALIASSPSTVESLGSNSDSFFLCSFSKSIPFFTKSFNCFLSTSK